MENNRFHRSSSFSFKSPQATFTNSNARAAWPDSRKRTHQTLEQRSLYLIRYDVNKHLSKEVHI